MAVVGGKGGEEGHPDRGRRASDIFFSLLFWPGKCTHRRPPQANQSEGVQETPREEKCEGCVTVEREGGRESVRVEVD
mgnify:CR=1 FL=1